MFADNAPRIPPLEAPYSPSVEADLARRMPKNSRVTPLALYRVLALHPGLSTAMEPLLAFLTSASASVDSSPSLVPRDREIVVLRVCSLCHCEYEWGVHVASFAKRVGLSTEQVEATLSSSDHRVWDDRDRALVRFVDALHERADVPDALWNTLAVERSSAQLLEILVLAGTYRTICFVANATRVPLEPWAARFPTRIRPVADAGDNRMEPKA